jgi:hypothetical protein
MDLLILECTPKGNNAREGMILKEFLTLPDHHEHVNVKLIECTNKKDFLKYLDNHICLNSEYNLIHLSGHGCATDKDNAFFYLPRGRVQTDEFPTDCFMGTHIGISACELGRTAFVNPFIKKTSPITIIGPQKVVPFSDACLFWINYYSLVLHHEHKPVTSFNKTVDLLKKRISGSFQFFESKNIICK